MPQFFEFPDGCRARGRNGQFTPRSARISAINASESVVSIFSQSEGPTAPIWLTGPTAQLAQLLRALANGIDPP